MTYRITLVASVVAVGVAFVPIAGGTAGQAQRVAIQSKGSVYSFTLKPVGTGRLRADVGKTTWNGSSTRTVIRNGQSVEIETVLGTFVGQRGRFAAPFRIEWTSAGNQFRAGVATWTFRNGTGAYEGLEGGGRSTAVIRPGGGSTMQAEGLLRS